MTHKSKLTLITFGLINLVATILLTIFTLPKQIPVAYDIYEKITHFSTKWIMLISSIIPTIFVVLLLIIKNNKLQTLFKGLFILSLFENMLFFAYFIVSENLTYHTLCEIPASISIFMPISFIMLIFSIKIKNVPYLSKPAFNFKVTRETEFIWKQTHFFAQKVLFITSFILFIVSIIFAIFRQSIIEFSIFIIAIITATLVVYFYSKSIFEKYNDMKIRKENLDKKKDPNTHLDNKKKKHKKNKKKIDADRLM